jgi:hypothetical protein
MLGKLLVEKESPAFPKEEEVVETKKEDEVVAAPVENEELKTIKEMLAKLVASNAELTEKTEKIMVKTTSYPGSLERDESNKMSKSDEPESFWAGRLFNKNNPKIQAILNA